MVSLCGSGVPATPQDLPGKHQVIGLGLQMRVKSVDIESVENRPEP